MKMTDAFVSPMNLDCDDKYIFIGEEAKNCIVVGEVFSFEADMYVKLDKDKYRKYAVRYAVKDKALKGAESCIKDGETFLLSYRNFIYRDYEYVAMKYIDERGVIVSGNKVVL